MKHSEMKLPGDYSAEIAAFRNDTDLEFEFIGTETWREYVFPCGETIHINLPRFLHVSESGGHRLYDFERICHYIPPDWIHLRWKVQDGDPHFVK